MLLLLGVAGCAARPQPLASPQAIALEVNSWGRPVASWRITAAGEGERVQDEPRTAGPQTFDRVTRRFAVPPDAFAAIRQALRPFEHGEPVACRTQMTDGGYGTVRWTFADGERSTAFRYGCTSRAADRLHAAIEAAWARIDPLAKAGTVTDRKVLPQTTY